MARSASEVQGSQRMYRRHLGLLLGRGPDTAFEEACFGLLLASRPGDGNAPSRGTVVLRLSRRTAR